MRIMNYIVFGLILLSVVGFAGSYIVDENMNMMENDIYNATNVNATYIYMDGTIITDLDSNSSEYWDNLDTPLDIETMGNFTAYDVNATCNVYLGTIQSTDGNSINVQPTGDTDDYFSFKTPAHRPTIKREGGKFIYFESSNVYDVGISFRVDATYSGTLNYEKDEHKMTLLGKNSPVAIKTNSEYVNYFLFETVNHQPKLSAYNVTQLQIADNMTIDGNLTVVGNITAQGGLTCFNSACTFNASNDCIWFPGGDYIC